MPTDRWTGPPDGFRYVYFEAVDLATNQRKFYYLSWQQTTIGWGIVRMWGRKGVSQNQSIEPAADLTSAWPSIRASIRARLRHGYRIVDEG